MARTLEQWVADLPAALHRLPSLAEQKLRDLGKRALELARAKAPVDSGNLRDSLRLQISAGEITIYSTAPYASITETGGIITGKPWLAIPLVDAVRNLPGPRSDPANLFVLRSKDGRLFLASRFFGHLEIRWKLQHQVTVRAQPFLGPAIDEAREIVEDDLLDAGIQELAGEL